MGDILEMIFQYRRLLARRDQLGTLSPEDEERLLGLERLFGSDPDDRRHDSRRKHARCEVQLPATIKIGGRVEPVDIVDLGAGGIRVEPAPLLRAGERAQVRIVSLDTGRMYVYDVEAKWAQRSSRRSTMGLPFVGPPKQLPLAA